MTAEYLLLKHSRGGTGIGREVRVEGEPMPGPGEVGDDTLQLYFLRAHHP